MNWHWRRGIGTIVGLTPDPGEHEVESYMVDRLREEPFIVFGNEEDMEPGPSVSN